MIRIAEIDFDPEKCFKFLVMSEQNVVVRREGTYFRISLLDPHTCLMNLQNRDREYQFEKGYPQLPIDNDEQNTLPTFPRNNEVRFCVAASCSLVYVLRPFTDEDSVIKLLQFCVSIPFSRSSVLPVCFNVSSVWAADVTVDALF